LTLATFEFTRALPPASDFSRSFDEADYVAVPDDWLVAVTDVEGSRKAIAAGRYKAVNMAGATMISALMNGLGGHDIPYIFGGDGAAVLLAPQERGAAEPVLAACITFVAEELELRLRAALVPVSRLRSDGFDVRVRMVRVSDAIANFAFVGGGLTHAEKLMKAGEFAVAPAPPGARPDLAGLSCRWAPVRDEGRSIVSLIVEPKAALGAAGFADLEARLLAVAGGAKSPLPSDGPGVVWPPAGLELEARATHGDRSLFTRRMMLYFTTFLGWFLFKTGMPLGSFSPQRYRKVTALNTDFRKIQDGLRMTLSLDPAAVARLRQWLEAERAKGAIRFGMLEQDSAVLTCYVPSLSSDAHYHFLDGAGGGYAGAASAMA